MSNSRIHEIREHCEKHGIAKYPLVQKYLTEIERLVATLDVTAAIDADACRFAASEINGRIKQLDRLLKEKAIDSPRMLLIHALRPHCGANRIGRMKWMWVLEKQAQ